MVNAALLERTMTHILDHPESHNQSIWISQDYDCGTTACFAGWTCLLEGQPAFCMTGLVARGLLGLTANQARILFHASNTVDDLQYMVKNLIDGRNILDGYREASE